MAQEAIGAGLIQLGNFLTQLRLEKIEAKRDQQHAEEDEARLKVFEERQALDKEKFEKGEERTEARLNLESIRREKEDKIADAEREQERLERVRKEDERQDAQKLDLAQGSQQKRLISGISEGTLDIEKDPSLMLKLTQAGLIPGTAAAESLTPPSALEIAQTGAAGRSNQPDPVSEGGLDPATARQEKALINLYLIAIKSKDEELQTKILDALQSLSLPSGGVDSDPIGVR